MYNFLDTSLICVGKQGLCSVDFHY